MFLHINACLFIDASVQKYRIINIYEHYNTEQEKYNKNIEKGRRVLPCGGMYAGLGVLRWKGMVENGEKRRIVWISVQSKRKKGFS